MQGTGTSTAPYIPETWTEFVTAVGTNGAYVSLPEGGGTFDMNEIAPEGITVKLCCNRIDGNGWIIHAPHDVIFKTDDPDYYYIVNDLHFLDIDFTGSAGDCMLQGSNRWMPFQFNRCTFTGKIAGGENVYLFDEVRSLNQCSINIAFVGNAHYLFNGSAVTGLTASSIKAKLDYSGCTYTSAEILDTQSDKKINDSFFEITNCDLDLNYYGSRSVFHFNNNGGYVRNADSEKKIVTEEQIRDAAYLNSVGYPIEVKA